MSSEHLQASQASQASQDVDGAHDAHRRDHLFALARAAEGFMPDDEGEALYRAALRAGQPRRGPPSSRWVRGAASRPSTWARRPRPPVPSCSAWTTTTAPRRTRRDGTPRPGAGRPRHRMHRHAASLAPDDRPRQSRDHGCRPDRRLPCRGQPVGHATGPLFHRRGTRRRAGVGRLPRLVAPCAGGRPAGHSRCVPRPRRRRSAPL